MALPAPPPDLPPDQQPIWADTTTRLTALGTNTVDPRHLRAYVSAAHQHAQLTRLVDQTGPMIQRGEQVIPNPAAAPQRQAARDLARLARTLGLTQTPTRHDAPATPMGAQTPMGDRPGQAEHWGARFCEEHNRWECTSKRSRGRGPCHALAQIGVDKCRGHTGGGQVRHLVAVAERQGAGIGGRLPGGGPVPEHMHPRDALLYQVRYWAGLCQWLDDILAGLRQGDLVWGMTRRQDTQGGEFPGVTVIEAAGLSTWAQWHERAHRQLASVCEMALRADVAADLVKLQRAQGLAAFRAFQAGLGRLNLTPEQWDRARGVMPMVLRELNAA